VHQNLDFRDIGEIDVEISSEKLQRLKDKELKILIEFGQVCEKLGINYSLSSGTLLGAVRHKGFIPWDDDIDVVMLREDYDKFLAKGQELLPDHLFIQTYETDKEYPYNFGKIRDTSTLLKEYATQTLNMKNGPYIDIFPVDRVSSNRLIRWTDNQLLALIYAIKFSYTIEWAKNSSSRLRGIMRRLLFPLARAIGPYRLNIVETSIRIKRNKNTNNFTFGDQHTTPPNCLKETMMMPIEYFETFEEIEFEHIKFKGLKEWDKYLTIMYGNYLQLPPEEKRVSFHGICKLEFND
jgi:lipopolysaccharide cholinephosphotransferase